MVTIALIILMQTRRKSRKPSFICTKTASVSEIKDDLLRMNPLKDNRSKFSASASEVRREPSVVPLPDAVEGLVKLMTESASVPPQQPAQTAVSNPYLTTQYCYTLYQHLLSQMHPYMSLSQTRQRTEPFSYNRNAALHLRVCYYISRNRASA